MLSHQQTCLRIKELITIKKLSPLNISMECHKKQCIVAKKTSFNRQN